MTRMSKLSFLIYCFVLQIVLSRILNLSSSKRHLQLKIDMERYPLLITIHNTQIINTGKFDKSATLWTSSKNNTRFKDFMMAAKSDIVSRPDQHFACSLDCHKGRHDKNHRVYACFLPIRSNWRHPINNDH